MCCFFSALLIFYFKKNLTLKWKSENSVSINILRESWPIIIISVASIINTRIDQVYIGSMLSSSVLGNFSAAAKVAEFWLVLPVIIHTVLYPILIDLRSINFNKYKRLIYLIISASFLFGVLFSGLITSFSTEIILILFGNKYNIAGEYLALYIWSTLPIFSLYIVGSVIYLENLIKKNLIVSGVSILANLILNYFFIQFYGANGAIYATLLVTLISYSLIGYFIYTHTKLLR